MHDLDDQELLAKINKALASNNGETTFMKSSTAKEVQYSLSQDDEKLIAAFGAALEKDQKERSYSFVKHNDEYSSDSDLSHDSSSDSGEEKYCHTPSASSRNSTLRELGYNFASGLTGLNDGEKALVTSEMAREVFKMRTEETMEFLEGYTKKVTETVCKDGECKEITTTTTCDDKECKTSKTERIVAAHDENLSDVEMVTERVMTNLRESCNDDPYFYKRMVMNHAEARPDRIKSIIDRIRVLLPGQYSNTQDDLEKALNRMNLAQIKALQVDPTYSCRKLAQKLALKSTGEKCEYFGTSDERKNYLEQTRNI